MRIVGILLLTAASAAAAAEHNGLSFRERALSYRNRATEPRTPLSRASSLSYQEIEVRVPKSDLGRRTYAFGVNCTGGTRCSAGSGETATKLVTIERYGEHALLIDQTKPRSPGHPDPVARWQVLGEDTDYLYVGPDLAEGLSMVHAQDSLAREEQVRVFDRFYHDFRSTGAGVWFHETIRYEYKAFDFVAQFLGEEAGYTVVAGADTLAIYLIDAPFSESFTAKDPLSDIGFFVNAESMEGQGIYDGAEPFNPSGLKAIRWRRERDIEWIVNHDVPDAIYPIIQAGILEWQQYLPETLRLKVRKARPEEELDAPFINSFIYTAGAPSVGGVASFSYHPTTGEIFRGNVNVSGPSDLSGRSEAAVSPMEPVRSQLKYGGLVLNEYCAMAAPPSRSAAMSASAEDMAAAIQGVVSHEVGHTLGLRHNFKGSLWAGDVARYPGGSSVMEYTADFKDLRIGPYDQEAIAWGYADAESATRPAFCADELAGFFFFTPSIDPACHRYDPTSADPFAPIQSRLVAILRSDVPAGRLPNDYMQISSVLTYIRHREALGFDADRFAKAMELLAAVGDFDAAATGAVAEAQWKAASILLRFLKPNLDTDQVLTYRALYDGRASLIRIFDWLAHAPADSTDAFRMRKYMVEIVADWHVDPFGRALKHSLEEALRHASANGSEVLQIENRFLLDILTRAQRSRG